MSKKNLVFDMLGIEERHMSGSVCDHCEERQGHTKALESILARLIDYYGPGETRPEALFKLDYARTLLPKEVKK